jgi:thiamine biosynthesis lipoprotein
MQAYKKIKALGTEVEFYLASDKKLDFNQDLRELELLVDNFEKRFSRFKENSELSLLNSSINSFKSSGDLINILIVAKEFYQITEGIFDPTILNTLESSGYDKSFDLIDSDKLVKHSNNLVSIDFNQVIIDRKNKEINKPFGLKIDLGGIGKGYVVDLLAKSIKNKGYQNFWVSAGGDMYLAGKTENDKLYQVGVQNPVKLESDLFNLTVIDPELAVATSGVAKRQWLNNGVSHNHVIDPRTNSSVENDLLAVTIVSDQTVKADIFAKTVLILGRDAGLNFISHQKNTECLIIDKKLEVSLSKNMNKYLTKI